MPMKTPTEYWKTILILSLRNPSIFLISISECVRVVFNNNLDDWREDTIFSESIFIQKAVLYDVKKCSPQFNNSSFRMVVYNIGKTYVL